MAKRTDPVVAPPSSLAAEQEYRNFVVQVPATPEPVTITTERPVLCRIEYYLDPEPTRPTGYRLFTERLQALSLEITNGWWATVGFDSLTYFELAARKHDEYVTNKRAKDGRQHYAASAAAIEENIMMRFGGMMCNVVVTAHTNSDRDTQGNVRLYMPEAPGKMPKKLPAGFSEVYRAYAQRNAEGQRQYLLQTETDAEYIASTRIHASDPCWPTYTDLWTGTRYEGMPIDAKPVIHAMVYGEPGAGKSTFLATFAVAGPMLVCMFDPYGKDMAYLELGEPGPLNRDGPVPYRDVYAVEGS